MNSFLDIEARNQERRIPDRIYARLDAVEEVDDQTFEVSLDGLDADWFDEQNLEFEGGSPAEDEFFDRAPIVSLDFTVGGAEARAFESLDRSSQDIDTDDLLWLSIDLVPPELGLEAFLYTNLFAEPRRTSIRRPAYVPQPDIAASLSKTFSLRSVRDSAQREIEQALQVTGNGAGVLVLDVGQGNCNAHIDSNGRPLCYFDFGAAVQQHKSTYPSGLKHFCFCNDPPIVLSHWDKDHWAAGNIDKNALRQTWIVPRQALGVSHRAFAKAIQSAGKLLVWPRGLPALTVGDLTIEKCTGTTRNDSGLAAQLEGIDRSGTVRRALLPGDARYTAIPGSNQAFMHVVSPHHGATLGANWTPTCPGSKDDRLVHSSGKRNKWSHPTRITRLRHDANGWTDSKVAKAAKLDRTRETTLRTGGFGHVFLPWSASTGIPSLPCCGTSTMTATQK